jgi:hypothetical protein
VDQRRVGIVRRTLRRRLTVRTRMATRRTVELVRIRAGSWSAVASAMRPVPGPATEPAAGAARPFFVDDLGDLLSLLLG